MKEFVMPELQSGEGHPIVTATCIKFATTFRNQLPQALLEMLVTTFAKFITHKQRVIHSYAAHGIDRLLTVRDSTGKKSASGREVTMVDLVNAWTLAVTWHALCQVFVKRVREPAVAEALSNCLREIFTILTDPGALPSHDPPGIAHFK